jgi:ribulose-5-phosphate 4-epimerase/fuculose-1-phosphate aldolase
MAVAALSANGKSVRDLVSPEEWETRVNLAALYRLVDKHGMTDLTATHISARIPGSHDQFLLNPHGLLFSQVTASNLVKIDVDGNLLMESEYPVNAAGFTIHSAVHMARHDIDCVAHTHTVAGMAISALPQGLMPFCQQAMRFHKRTSYHDFEGIADDLEERERLVRDMGDTSVMLLRNHGHLVCGRTIRHAWVLLYRLEKVSKAQLAALATGAKLLMPSDAMAEHASRQFDDGDRTYRQDGWESQLRLLDRVDSSYRH